MRAVVVGGGIAGLYVSIGLRRTGISVLLLESRPTVGGRVRTVYEEGDIAYEAGPWRVDESHTRCRALFSEFGVELIPAPKATTFGRRKPPVDSPNTGLTSWGVTALDDPALADTIDRLGGSAGETHSAYGSNPYSADGPFLVAPSGFSKLIERLEERSLKSGVEVRTDARVVDIVKAGDAYSVRTKERRGRRFASYAEDADMIVLCVPPHVWREWPLLAQNAKSLACAVDVEALHHVYVRWKDPSGPLPKETRVDDTLGEVVASQYDGSRWWQISYSGGRMARLWNNLALQDDKSLFDHIRQKMRHLFRGDFGEFDVRRHFWPFAYHKWKAVPNFDLERSVAQSICPNPARLPGMYCAGEAFSSTQGWMEGALQTADMVLERVRKPTHPTSVSSRWTVFVEGRPIDVSSFKGVHPGGEEALRNHIGENVDDLMAHIGHSDHSWAIVHSLK